MALRAIMAVSQDGFVARGPADSMDWTGRTDKQVFKLLTCLGGNMAAGKVTYDLMKDLVLPGRRLLCVRSGGGKALEPNELTLGELSYAARRADFWLIGGQTVLLEAVTSGMVEEVVLCTAPKILGEGVQDAVSPVLDETWAAPVRCVVDDVRVRIYRRG